MKASKQLLKCDFHAHSGDDPKDRIFYSSEELIDEYARQRFDVISLTLHEKVHFPKALRRYAAGKGILLIKGAEATILGKHVVILNISDSELRKIHDFDDLRAFRRNCKKKGKPFLVIAAHPFYNSHHSLNSLLVENVDCFDAVEYSSMHLPLLNPYNKKAVRFAKQHGLAVIGTGDVHHLMQLGKTCTMVPSMKDAGAVISSLKQGKGILKSVPMGFFSAAISLFNLFFLTSKK